MLILGNNRQEDLKMVQWSEQVKNGTGHSDRSFTSGQSASGSCTRDSGAGDSVESEYDTLEGHVDHNHHFPLMSSCPSQFPQSQSFSPLVAGSQSRKYPITSIIRKPTFTTFMGDSDNDSVQIIDYSKASL